MDIRNLVSVASATSENNQIVTKLHGFPNVSLIHKVFVERDPKSNEAFSVQYTTEAVSAVDQGQGVVESDKYLALLMVEQNQNTYDQFIDSMARLYFV